MKPEELKLYNKYYDVNKPNKELIYIGIDKYNYYCFLFKDKDAINSNVNYLNIYGLNTKQIIKDLKLETFIDIIGEKYIKGYSWCYFIEKHLIDFKPLLKDKLKNIINR